MAAGRRLVFISDFFYVLFVAVYEKAVMHSSVSFFFLYFVAKKKTESQVFFIFGLSYLLFVTTLKGKVVKHPSLPLLHWVIIGSFFFFLYAAKEVIKEREKSCINILGFLVVVMSYDFPLVALGNLMQFFYMVCFTVCCSFLLKGKL